MVNPPIALICLRANWAVPGVFRCYIKYENAGDLIVAKNASGRCQNNKSFLASLPYWDLLVEDPDTKDACKRSLHSFLRDLLPDETKNHKIFGLHKMAYASMTYHRDYLSNRLCSDSILRSSFLWNDNVPFADKVVVRYPWDTTSNTPEITGLQPHIVLLAKVKSLQLEMKAAKADV